MFVDFTKGVKSFKLWHHTSKKFIISKDVHFREIKMFMQGKGNIERNHDAIKAYTTQIEVENTRNSAQSTKETIITDQEQVKNIGGEQIEIVEEQPDLSQYSSARDRQRRIIVPSATYVEINYISFVVNANVAPNDNESCSFEEVVNSNDARQ